MPADTLPASGASGLGAEAAAGRIATETGAAASRWMGWRLRLLVMAALLGCVGLFVSAQWLAEQPHLSKQWQRSDSGSEELTLSGMGARTAQRLPPLVAVVGADGQLIQLDSSTLQTSARWLIDDASRELHLRLHQQLADALSQPSVILLFGDGSTLQVPSHRRGFAGLGSTFWLLSGLALGLYLAAMVVLLARPSKRTLLYATMSLCQAGNLAFIAVASTNGLGLPRPFPAWDGLAPMAFDLVTAAAAVHAASLVTRGIAWARGIAIVAWAAAGTLIALTAIGWVGHAWWWAQAGVAVLSLLAIALLSLARRGKPHPLATQLRHYGIAALLAWLLLTVLLAVAQRLPGMAPNLAGVASMVWYAFLAMLLLLAPFIAKSQQVLREFYLLAAISTVATALDLLFVAVFALGQVASLTLSLFLSLAVYSGVRQWVLNRVLGSRRLTTERMFEQLYRIAREVETHPNRVPALLLQLLRDLFDPLEAQLAGDRLPSAQVEDDGSTLCLPVPAHGSADEAAPGSIRLRFAQRGQRVFTTEDARLADRIVEQLRRAVAFDQAVEQGRKEERLRLAQDLHDDIGARLLTLMYKAQSPEVEEYVRHTLKDLKTLTRGLAAPSHMLSHAAAEWKADLTQRLTAADVELGWSFSTDRDIMLSVVQWSALTRILRELVSNAIAHAGARRVQVALQLEGERLDLSVADDGCGRNPGNWSHGLGLAGVRKRVKQLGGEIEWHEAEPAGIDCRVCIPMPATAD